jgi:hypothetical protein
VSVKPRVRQDHVSPWSTTASFRPGSHDYDRAQILLVSTNISLRLHLPFTRQR